MLFIWLTVPIRTSEQGETAEISSTSEDLPQISQQSLQNGANRAVPIEGQISSREYAPQHLSVFDVLMEIARRIAEVQISEAENELNALGQTLNNWTGEEKIEFLNFFVRYMNDGNAFNPEAILAFDQVWNSISLDQTLRIASAEILASHYIKFYEFDFAIAQYEVLLNNQIDLNATQLDGYSRALFQMNDYQTSINAMLLLIDVQQAAQEPIAREIHSRLFEAYFRPGDVSQAEQVGQIILDSFEDIQDWKDMEQFYLATENEAGLQAHFERARAAGLMDEAGDWID
ncbi:MAG: hypothetical protein GKR91_05360 [Pseudomonadales bacterium]|nr:hypothetical protein [Pseudomonadales bacterium]